MTTREIPIQLVHLLDQARLEHVDIFGNLDVRITGVSTNAQRTERNNLFVAIRGTKTDSHMLISEAVARGAAAVMVERETPSYPGVTMIRVPDTHKALGPVAHAALGNPARAMKIAAVTGTNGKTTTAAAIAEIMRAAGHRTGLIGTLGAFWEGKHYDFGTTTPDAVTMARIVAMMEKDCVDFIALEASSHGIDQARISGLPIHAAALTNISQDHLDYHGSFAAYVAAKRKLFFDYVAPTPGSVCCFNRDDLVGEELCESYDGEFLSFSACGREECHVLARGARLLPTGTEFELVVNKLHVPVKAKLLGAFNLSNMVAAAAVCTGLGIDPRTIAEGLGSYQPMAGRFESIQAGQPFQVIVDYAHTPDALEKALRTARQITAGQLFVVFGCGGDRDRTKRPMMGKIAGQFADHAIVTSDNPRNEDPNRINRQVMEGLVQSGMRASKYQSILDRRIAIERALHLAKAGDTVLVAGKGHENYQEIGGIRYHLDDREIARAALTALAGSWPCMNEQESIATRSAETA